MIIDLNSGASSCVPRCALRLPHVIASAHPRGGRALAIREMNTARTARRQIQM